MQVALPTGEFFAARMRVAARNAVRITPLKKEGVDVPPLHRRWQTPSTKVRHISSNLGVCSYQIPTVLRGLSAPGHDSSSSSSAPIQGDQHPQSHRCQTVGA
jgi:hypothetical protein